MQGSLNEIASIINEGFYYFKRFYYHTNKRESIDLSIFSSQSETNTEWLKTIKQQDACINKINLENLKAKPFITQLILDLCHIFEFSIFKEYKQDLTNGKFTKLQYGKEKPVTGFKEAARFFRDAFVHPEHSPDNPSPRSLPSIPQVNLGYYLFTPSPNGDKTDFCIQVAEGKIWLKADILKCLNNLKNECLKQDKEGILKNFKWQKYTI